MGPPTTVDACEGRVMGMPRVSLKWLMAAVVAIAIDCTTIRSLGARPESLTGMTSMYVLCTLPLAGVLAVASASAVGRRGRPLRSRIAFVAGGCVALAATLALLDPALTGLERLLNWAGIARWFEASEARMWAFGTVVVPALILVAQLLFALAACRAARRFEGPAGPAAPSGPPHGRLRVACVAAAVVFAASPAVALESFLRWQVDPKTARLPAGSVAILRTVSPVGIRVTLPGGSKVLVPNGSKVRIDDDREPIAIGGIALAGPSSPRIHGDLRRVQVTLLDGAAAGKPTALHHCFLRPID